ncbi:MAG TPA: AAA family ATPase, partial [Acidobacteriota bacterium]|nr:AAA family ATPase [Acidobacteriota bacterium]
MATRTKAGKTVSAVRRKKEIIDDLGLLLGVLPSRIRNRLKEKGPDPKDLIEIVLDLGRPPEARFFSGVVYLNDLEVTREDLEKVVNRVGDFTGDNRAGIERTLHRISAIRNRRHEVIGLTCRVGRAITGTVDIIRDVIESGKSLLLLGPPGVGKTTLLREAARVLADELGKRVVVVDTSNEIAGDGDVPHPAIGHARRMQVPTPEQQHKVMIEAVENHMPEVIVIDEIGTEQEAAAARTIAERGVQLVATAHGITLDNLIINPTLSDLIGGVQAVTLSDEEARRRGTQKTVLERKARPTFDILVEIQTRNRLAVYPDIGRVVDRFLTGAPLRPEARTRGVDGQVEIERSPAPEPPSAAKKIRRSDPREQKQSPRNQARPRRRLARIYPIGVSKTRLERAIRELGVTARLADQPVNADVILSLKPQRKRQPKRLQEALDKGVEFYTVKSNTMGQIKTFLQTLFGVQSP